ncbi:hypothetical protein UlMin_034482 [Ulmus minor]
MDHHDVETSEAKNNVGRLCSPKKQSPLGKTNILSDCCEGEVSADCSEGNASKKIPIKSDVSSDSGHPIDKDVHAGLNGHLLGKGEKGLKLVIQEAVKTESSSSNSSHVILPASSIDSCQENSLDMKSCKQGKINAMNISTYADCKSNVKETAVGIIQPGNGKLASDDKLENNSDKVVGSDPSISDPFKKENMDLGKLELDDAMDMARRVAREVEQECEASGSSSSVQGRNRDMVHQSFVDSADSNRKSCLTETRTITHSFSFTKELGDAKPLTRNESLCSEGKETSLDLGAEVIHEVNDVLQGRELSHQTMKPKSPTSKDHKRYLSSLDLNEDILEHAVECPEQLAKKTVLDDLNGSVSRPIPMVAKSGIPLYLLASQVKREGRSCGWRGFAATSAFRPTSITQSCTRNKASSVNDENECAKDALVKMIDLNITATGGDFEDEILQEKTALAELSFPSNVSSVEESAAQAKKFDFDLNCATENDDCHPLSPPTSLSRCSMRDFDLNDNLTSADTCIGAHQHGHGNQAWRNKGLDSPAVSSVENSEQQDLKGSRSTYSVDLNSMQGFIPGHAHPFLIAPPNMLPSNEQMQRVAFLQPQLTYTQPPSNAFCVDPRDSLSSSLSTHGVLPYMIDPNASSMISQVLGSGAGPLSGFSRAPHVIQVPHGSYPNDMAMMRSNIDVYNRVSGLENGNRGANASQFCIPSSTLTMEENMRNFQLASVPATGMKRREPEGGWDSSPQLCFRQANSWR